MIVSAENCVTVVGGDVLLLGTDEDHRPDPDAFIVIYRHSSPQEAEHVAGLLRQVLSQVIESARREGAEEMREMASSTVEDSLRTGLLTPPPVQRVVKMIRALPLPGGEPDER